MARRLAGLVIIDGTDDEIFSDERVHREAKIETVLDENQPAAVLQVPDVKWGGECRVEVNVSAQVVGPGDVQIRGTAKLFEGASEETDDLEDQQDVVFLVPRGGRPASHLVNLRNTGLGGGDHAEVRFHLTNSIDEGV